MDEPEHVAEQRTWRCRSCRAEWPCLDAKRQLVATHTQTELAILALLDLQHAARDLPHMPLGDAFDRFVTWTWPHNATAYEMPPE